MMRYKLQMKWKSWIVTILVGNMYELYTKVSARCEIFLGGGDCMHHMDILYGIFVEENQWVMMFID